MITPDRKLTSFAEYSPNVRMRLIIKILSRGVLRLIRLKKGKGAASHGKSQVPNKI